MKRAIYVSLTLALTVAASTAAAAGPEPKARFTDAQIRLHTEEITKRRIQLKIAELNNRFPKTHDDVKFTRAGLGIGATAGSNSTTGGSATTAAGLHVRSFREGTSGAKPDPARDPYEGYAAHMHARSEVKDEIKKDLNEFFSKQGLQGEELTKAEFVAYERLIEIVDFDQDLLNAVSKYSEQKREAASSRPMHFFEGNAQYNMIGTQANGGAFTGVTGDVRGGLGFSLKNFSQNGCDLYFMATGNATGQAHYNASSLDSVRAATGIEQGLLCQVGNAVTFMASPSVQIGKLRHSLPGGNLAKDGQSGSTDWLNYAMRGRLIWNDRMYVSGEYIHHPDMKGGSPWKATEISGNVDVRIDDKWVVGARVKNLRMQDTQGQNADINDTQVGIQAYRAF